MDPRKSRSAGLILSACATVLATQVASAATDLWDGGDGAGTAWLDNTNWNMDLGTGTGPTGGDIAQFDSAGAAANVGIDFSAAINNGDSEAVGRIDLTGGISRTITNSSTSTAGILQLNSAGTVDAILLINSAPGLTLTLANGATQPMDVRLNASAYIGVSTDASIVINSLVKESAGGTKGFLKRGAGSLVLTGANTFGGGVTIEAGTISINTLLNTGSAQSLGVGASAISLGLTTNATLLYSGAGTATNRGIALFSAGGTISNTNALTFSGIVSGNGALTKGGGGNLALGGANTYAGGTIINDGTVSVGADTRLGAAPTTAQVSNITINAGTLSGSAGFNLNSNRGILLGAPQSAIDVQAGVVSFNGIITGSGTLNKTGPGALDLRLASNTYTGGTVLKAGRLDITQDRNLGVVPTAPQAANVTLDGGTLRFYNSSAGGLTLDPNRGVSLTASGGTIDFSQSSSASPTIGYPITSSAGSVLTKVGIKTVLSNIAQPNMNGDLSISQGRWSVQANGAAGNGTILLQAANADIAQLGIAANSNVTVTLSNAIVLNPIGTGSNSFEVGNSTPTQNELRLTGNITGTGGLLKGSVAGTTGILTLGGNNTYAGATTVNLGTLRVGGGSAIPDASFVTLAGSNTSTVALDLTASEALGGLSGGAATTAGISLGVNTLTVNQNADDTYTGAISGAGGSFVKSGSSTLTLTSAASSYSGSTVVSAGTLVVTSAAALGDGSASNTVQITGGSKLQVVNDFNSPLRDLLVNSGGGEVASESTVTLRTGLGTSNLTKSGTGTLNINSLRMGNVTISGGRVVIPATGGVSAAGVSRIGAISIASNALLNLNDNKLITTSPAGTWNGSAYTGVTGLVVSGRGSGNFWDGTTGIVTTQTQAIGGNYTSIAVAAASDVRPNTATETALWAGQTITGTDTLVMYTYGGDATLDGKINIDDYVRIDNGISAGMTGWANGDFNYDGAINIDDYTQVIDFNIDIQMGAFFTSARALPEGETAVTAVPEPVSLGLLLAPVLFSLNHRKRRH